MAIVARMTNVATRQGFGQGALAGDRQNMHALIKIAGPMLYGSLFALGCKVGMPSLPFFFAATMGSIAWLSHSTRRAACGWTRRTRWRWWSRAKRETRPRREQR